MIEFENSSHTASQESKQRYQQSELLSHEIEHIKGQRQVLRLFDPQGVYFYRHVASKPWHIVCHFLSLVFHFLLWLACIYWWMQTSTSKVLGVGDVADFSLLEVLLIGLVVFYIYRFCSQLVKTQEVIATSSYKLAMLANCFNASLLVFLKVYIVFLGLFSFSVLLVVGPEVIASLSRYLHSGNKGNDYRLVFNFCLLIVIIKQQFKYCTKEVE